MSLSNEERADNATAALLTYAELTRHRPEEANAADNHDLSWQDCVNEQVGDLLCDLRHLCDRWGIDYSKKDLSADVNYHAEVHGDEYGDPEPPASKLPEGTP